MRQLPPRERRLDLRDPGIPAGQLGAAEVNAIDHIEHPTEHRNPIPMLALDGTLAGKRLEKPSVYDSLSLRIIFIER
jgi:hypothetical protein